MSTTINSYGVSLTMDADKYIEKSRLSRKETMALTRQINSTRTPVERYDHSIRALDKALAKGGISQKTYNRLVADAYAKTQKTSKATSGYATNVLQLAAAFATLKVSQAAITSAKLGIELEQQQVAFRVLIGDARMALEFQKELQRFAAKTPFEAQAVSAAGKQLIAFGFSTHQVGKELEILGNLAAGTNQPLGELAELVGKARVQQRIYSEDLNQFTGRGINVLDGLADRFGVTTSAVKKLASEGKIGFSDLQAVLEGLTLEGGKFAGLIEEQSKTVGGKLSTVSGNVKKIAGEWALANMELVQHNEYLTAAGGLISNIAETLGARLPDEKTMFGMLSNQEFLDTVNGSQPEKAFTPGNSLTGYGMKRGPSVFDQDTLPPDHKLGDAIANGIRDGLQSGSGSVGSGLMAGFDMLASIVDNGTNVIAQANHIAASTVVKAQEESPAIKAMEAGSQEAYRFMTEGVRRQQAEEAKKEERAKRIEANGEKMVEALNEAVEVFKTNGWDIFG